MLERFDFDTYRRMLRWISSARPCVGFREALEMGGDDFCLVRHDIDLSLAAAVRMAEVDADVGVRSTFFLLFSAPQYNLLTRDNSRVPRRLVELGHDVGLHYDTSAVDQLPADEAVAVFRTQAELLGALSGAPVTAVARHNPGFGGFDPMAQTTGFVSAYDPRFTSEITYVSDSCGAWRAEGLEVLTAAEPPRKLQLLTHPIFWTEEGADRWTQLDRLRLAQLQELEAEAAAARDVWSGHPAVAAHDLRVQAALAGASVPDEP